MKRKPKQQIDGESLSTFRALFGQNTSEFVSVLADDAISRRTLEGWEGGRPIPALTRAFLSRAMAEWINTTDDGDRIGELEDIADYLPGEAPSKWKPNARFYWERTDDEGRYGFATQEAALAAYLSRKKAAGLPRRTRKMATV